MYNSMEGSGGIHPRVPRELSQLLSHFPSILKNCERQMKSSVTVKSKIQPPFIKGGKQKTHGTTDLSVPPWCQARSLSRFSWKLLRRTENEELLHGSQDGFTKGKSCLTNLVIFCDGDRALGRGRATDSIYLDLCKVFGTLPDNFTSLFLRCMETNKSFKSNVIKLQKSTTKEEIIIIQENHFQQLNLKIIFPHQGKILAVKDKYSFRKLLYSSNQHIYSFVLKKKNQIEFVSSCP